MGARGSPWKESVRVNALLHWLTEWGHLMTLAVALFVLAVVSILVRDRRSLRPGFRLIGKQFRASADLSFLRAQGWERAPRAYLQWQGRFALPPLASPAPISVTDLAWADVEGLRCTALTTWAAIEGLGSAAFVTVNGQARVWIEMVDLPVVLPPVAIYPPWLLGDVEHANPFLGQPFSSESADFNARWAIRGGDPRYLSAVLSPRVMDRLLGDDLTDMVICLDGAAIVGWFPGPLVAEAILPRMAILRDLVRRIPQQVLNDFGTPRPDANGGPWDGGRWDGRRGWVWTWGAR
jgi:hypothetical protein